MILVSSERTVVPLQVRKLMVCVMVSLPAALPGSWGSVEFPAEGRGAPTGGACRVETPQTEI